MAGLLVDFAAAPAAPLGRHLLAAIGHGAGAEQGLVSLPLAPLLGGGPYELWHLDQPVTPFALGAARGAVSAEYAFAAVEIAEDLEAGTEAAYRALYAFLEAAGGFLPIRFWNYIAAITAPQAGMERYWRFNIGRKRAFADLMRAPRPPVATGIGCAGARSFAYVLAARSPAAPVENPRQVSAFAYPERYGPASPGFSRASSHGGETLFISGTASIVGHETLHAGDFTAQLDETLRNLDTMMGLTAQSARTGGRWRLKTYLRDPAQAPAVQAALAAHLGGETQLLHLAADICRQDLLVEIEAVRCG